MRLATWNVNSLRVRLPQLLAWLEANPVDVIGLQETKCIDTEFPREALEALGYHVVFNGQRTYNGVAVLSREPPRELVCDLPGFEDPQRRVLAACCGELRFVNLYVPNGQAPGSDKYAYKLRWLEHLRAWLAEERTRHERLVVVGDFNIAPEDRDVHDPAAWAGGIHVSEPERAALRAVLEAGFVDAFRLFEQPAASFSWWDYRTFAFRRNHGLRIDLILADVRLAAQCRECHIDLAPRRAERPSDHAPVVASFDIGGS